MNIPSDLQNTMNVLRKVNFKELERSEELGRDYNFKESAKLLREIHKDLDRVVKDANLLRVPDSMVNRVTSLSTRTNEYIQQIRDFVLKGNEAQAPSQYQQIKDNVVNLYQDSLDILPNLIERIDNLKAKSPEVEEQISEALKSAEEIEEIKQKVQSEKEGVEEAKKDIDIIIKDVRDALGKEGALISVSDFEGQAEEHKKLAKWWFIALIGVIAFTTTLVVVLFKEVVIPMNLLGEKVDYPMLIQATIFKLVLLSIAYLLVHQSIKNYKVNRHLYVLNRHRQLTLTVYPLMAKATGDPEQSNLIVSQAAKAIFDPGTTGYLNDDDNPNPINLTEIINRMPNK